VSDTFAAALWGLEFMHWWAAHGAAGLNFHSGDRVAAGSNLLPSKYTAYHSISNGYHVRPLGYAIKAFDLGGRGRVISAQFAAGTIETLPMYGVLAEDGTVYVTLINQDYGQSAKDVTALLLVREGYASAQVMFLTAPEGDVAAKSGITLGGAEIKHDGSWNGKWSAPRELGRQGEFFMTLPAASAAIVRFNK